MYSLPSVGIDSDQVARLVHNLAKLFVQRVLHKAHSRSFGIVVIAFADVGTQQTQLSNISLRHRFPQFVKDQKCKVLGDMSQRRQPLQILKVAFCHLVTGANAGALCWPVDIEELAGIRISVVELLQFCFRIAFAAEDKTANGAEVFPSVAFIVCRKISRDGTENQSVQLAASIFSTRTLDRRPPPWKREPDGRR